MLEVLLLLSLGVLGISLIGSGDGGGDDDSDAPEMDPEEPIIGTLGDGDDSAVLTDNADSVEGGAGNDLIDALGGPDWVRGNDGNDTLLGGDGNDFLAGNAGADEIDGQDGNDLLRGGVGPDLIQGGAGDDLIETGLGGDRAWGDEGNDTIVISEESGDELPFNEVYGGLGDDLMLVDNSNAQVSGDQGNDTIAIYLTDEDAYVDALGGEGDDLIVAGETGIDASIYASGGEGNATIDVGAGGYVSGDAGDDVILAEGIEIYGGAGSDLFVGDLTGDRSMSGVVLDFLPGEDAILFDVPGRDLEDAELVIGEPAFSEVYGRSLTEIALTAGGQTYSIFVQTAEEIQPDDIIVRGA
ncbi:calcium-binding protein [Salipiger bermudensis]|uniref:calcium-binding protein n=1 Tax=Salipiger bermudensis TaxID=344736 RepID=UPI0035180CA0